MDPVAKRRKSLPLPGIESRSSVRCIVVVLIELSRFVAEKEFLLL
jgi:hypothetical protein